MPRRSRIRRSLRTDRRGVTAVEYGVMAALVAAVVGLAMSNVGQALVGMWQDVTAAFPPDRPAPTPGQFRTP